MNSDYPYNQARELVLQGSSRLAFDILDLHGYIDKGTDVGDRVAVYSAPKFALKGRNEPVFSTTVLCSFPDVATIRIRAELKRLLPHFRDGVLVDKIESLNLTNEDKAHSRSYHPGHVIDVHQSSHALEKDHSYTVARVERAECVRLDNGSLLPLNMPDTFTVYQRHPKGFELCVGDLVRLPHKCPSTPPNTDPRLTHRVVGLMGGFVFLTEAWPPASENKVSRDSTGIHLLAMPMTYGRFTYGFCQKPTTPLERTYDYIYSVQESWTPYMAQQFRACVLGARTQSITFTNAGAHLRESLLVADEAENFHKRERFDTALQEPERASKARSTSREAPHPIKGEIDHER